MPSTRPTRPPGPSTTLAAVANSTSTTLLPQRLLRLLPLSHTVPARRAAPLLATQLLPQIHTRPTTAAEAEAVVPNWRRANIDLVAVASTPTSRRRRRLLTAWARRTLATTTLGTAHHRTTPDLLVTLARSGRMFSQLPAMHQAKCLTSTLTTVVLHHQAS